MLSSDDEPQDAEAYLIEGGTSMPSAPAEPILAGKASQPGLNSSQPHHHASTPPNFALQAAQAKGAARSPSILLSKPKVKMARPSQAAAVEPTAAAQIRHAILETPACAPIKMPWEQGSWAGIFGLPPSIPSIRLSALPRVPEPPPPPRPLCPVIPRVPGMPAVQASFSRLDDQAERTKAIRMFHTMIIAHPEATATGKQLVKSAKTLLAPGGTLGVMADTLAKSKTGTLVKHASALWKFAAFVQAQNIESPFSANEEHIYHYLCDLRNKKAGPTSGNTFLSAFRYAASTFGLVLPLESLDSKRARGVAHDMFLRKAPRRKAPALSVSAVHRLISLVLAQDIPKHVRLIAGQILLCIFGVARWGDLRRMQHLTMDQHESVIVFEVGSTDHKLAQTAEAQVELLPFIGLGVWPKEEPWLPVFCELRQQEGIVSGGLGPGTVDAV